MLERNRSAVAVALAMAALVTPACGRSDPRDLAATRSYAIEQVAGRAGGQSRIRLYRSVDELLPNVRFGVDDEPAKPITEMVVVGRITRVEPGRGFVVDGADAPGGRVVDFSDPTALWRTLHLTVSVTERLGTEPPPPTITVGLAVDGGVNVGLMVEGLLTLGRVVMFLERSPVLAYDASLFAILEDGALLATLDPDGRISLPAAPAEEAAELLGSSTTLAALRQKVAAAPRIVKIALVDGVPTRPAP